tara:strand:- start:20122 stop:20508 length:387 start_codon:yes stop_codon:yes gene_type:complete
MTAIQEVLKAIKSIEKKGNLLSKDEILSILEATRSITKHTQIVNSLIFFFTTITPNINHKKIDYLTKREIQILQLIGNGKSTINIANKLNLSNSTIETHRKNIRKKLGLVGKGKLIEYAILYNLKGFN